MDGEVKMISSNWYQQLSKLTKLSTLQKLSKLSKFSKLTKHISFMHAKFQAIPFSRKKVMSFSISLKRSKTEQLSKVIL